jgi:hypothetical protein
MKRRTYLAGSVGVTGAIAGCSGFLGGSSSSEPSGPAEVAKAMLQAIIAGDIEAANDYRHGDAPGPPVGPANVESFQAANAAVERASVESRNGDTATVHVVVSARDESGERDTVTFRYEMRRAGDEWRVYDDLRATDAPNLPSVEFETEARTNDDGEVTALAFMHDGGDDVARSALHARVMDASAWLPREGGEGDRLQAGATLVVPLDADGESYQELTRVLLIWTGPDSPRSETIAYHQLSTSTAGALGETLVVVR